MNLKALLKVSYGIYIVTSRKGDQINGQIANTVFQVTSEPPTVAVSINKNNLTWQFIKESRVFAVAVLCQDTPLTFIGRFGFKSGRDINKFEGINYETAVTGAPIVLDNTVSFLEAKVTRELEVGTHTIFAGDVVNAEVISDETCMTYEYYRQIKGGKTPKAAATYIAEKKVKMETQPGAENTSVLFVATFMTQNRVTPKAGLSRVHCSKIYRMIGCVLYVEQTRANLRR